MSENTGDIVNKIVQANALENSGEIESAIAIYEEILELDRGGNYGDVAQQALDNLQKTTVVVEEAAQEKASSWWARSSINIKTTCVLIGAAFVSSISISMLAYFVADKTVNRVSNVAEQASSHTLTKEIAFFMRERYGDIQVIAGLSLFADPELRLNSNIKQKQTLLNNYIKAYGIYDNIAAFDLQGNMIAKSTGEALGNHQDRRYFQAALNSNQPFISQPILSKSTGILAIYLAAPIQDTKTGQTIGIMRARMPVDGIKSIIQSTSDVHKSYLVDNQGQIFLSSDKKEYEQLLTSETKAISLASRFDFHKRLQREWNRRRNNKSQETQGQQKAKNQQSAFYGAQEVGYLTTFSEIEAEFVEGLPDLGWSTVTTIDNDLAFATQKQLLRVLSLGTLVVLVIVAILARLIAKQATKPLIQTVEVLEKIGQGDLSARLEIQGEDEIADLGIHVNTMAGQIQDLLQSQEEEAQRQRQERDRVQQGVMNLLLDVESAQKGDLTIKAQMTDGAVGSIADAFNATIRKLRLLLQQVQTVSGEVGQLSLTGEDSVLQLSESALSQAEEINQAVSSIDEINKSVETVANYAQEAAQIARQGSIKAKEGDLAMDETVNSIEKIRTTVASTSKKVKQLAESSQEIAQIVEIISGISEKTNLLAFNASVEAARAGEHGEGFRIVAEEVRRLADRITEATKDIQQLVTTIQQDTGSVLQGMETSTSEVVNGSELIRMTKVNLRSLAETNKQIDDYLKDISTSTIEQTNTSQEVNQKINGIAVLAKANSTDAQSVVQSLRTLVSEAEILQASLSQFIL